MSTSNNALQLPTVGAPSAAMIDTKNAAGRSRKKMYKNCDRCRQAKRACSAQYASIAEALASKVACTNCKKKGQVCTFNSLINSFGGIPLGGLTGAAFAESLTEAASAPVDEVMEQAESGSAGGKRRRESQESATSAFEVLNGHHLKGEGEEAEERDAKRPKQSESTFASFADFDQPASNTSSLVLSRGQSPFPSTADDFSFSSNQSGPSLFDVLGFDIWGSAPNVRLSATADRLHLNTDLLNVYEGAAESAFRVWVTDATTPYLLSSDSLSSSSAAIALNKKVCLLDQASKRIFKPDESSRNVEKRVSEAYHTVLLAYAAQWPRHRSSGGGAGRGEWKADEARIRLSLWKQARDKLMDAADAWSFRIVFALILFAWTEKPREVPDDQAWGKEVEQPSPLHVPSLSENSALDSSSWQIPAEASTMMLATAMRKLKAFRLKIQQLRRRGIDLWSTAEPGLDSREVAHREAEATLLENTYHNLYWFGCMMDTELSVLRKYDAVIGDEDSDLTDQLLSPGRASSHREEVDSFSPHGGGRGGRQLKKIWDEIIPANSQSHRHTFAKSWPCSEEEAKRTLAYATPIKVLLFRHVGRLQSSYWRQASGEQIERQIAHVLSVVRHWDETFAPFFASCITHHSSLPPSIQSWHVITATKWNLAAILLVELVSSMDRTAADPFTNTDEIFSQLRSKICHQTSALIHAIQTSSLPITSSEFDFIECTGSTILHSDPWPEISVHGFACVAKSEIKHFAQLVERGEWEEVRRAEERVEKCIWALEQLSNRSTMAVDATVEVRRLLELHSPLRQAFMAAGQQGGEGEVLTEDVWQSCLKILNEAPTDGVAQPTFDTTDAQLWGQQDLGLPTSSSLGEGSTTLAGEMGEFFLPSLNNDSSSSRASSNHSLSPPFTSDTMTQLTQTMGGDGKEGGFDFGLGSLDAYQLRV